MAEWGDNTIMYCKHTEEFAKTDKARINVSFCIDPDMTDALQYLQAIKTTIIMADKDLIERKPFLPPQVMERVQK